MSLPAIRQYADLVRRGVGNEEHLLTLLRQHRDQVTAQIEQLTESLGTVTHKISAYSRQLAEGATGPITCTAPQSS
ncbi:MerR family DNA-binding protein [Nonomuraea sp. B12E4]|uniref:MerR family DNA-binding protein n=1 Tax=Nonomuraea sp. B12E4 TaxID=3153564 RepID=UPI00325EDF56